MNYKYLGMNIRSHRALLHLTQEQLAERADLSVSYIGHIERGSRKASLEALEKIALALNVKIGRLVDDFDYTIPEPPDYFSIIRKALSRLETNYYENHMT